MKLPQRKFREESQNLHRTQVELQRQHFKCLNNTDKYQLRTFLLKSVRVRCKAQNGFKIFQALGKYFVSLGLGSLLSRFVKYSE